jgi:hypothetical protein
MVPFFGALDLPYRPVPSNGITFAECISSLPLMTEQASAAGLTVHFVRGKSQKQIWPGPNWHSVTDVVFHPSSLNAVLLEQININPNFTDRFDITELGTGYVVRINQDWVNSPISTPLPPASMITEEEWRMWTNSPPLNEFGYLYVALYLAGNYPRYYPDRWVLDVERSTPLALAIEELCEISEWRVPWLALCELGRTLLVNEA